MGLPRPPGVVASRTAPWGSDVPNWCDDALRGGRVAGAGALRARHLEGVGISDRPRRPGGGPRVLRETRPAVARRALSGLPWRREGEGWVAARFPRGGPAR